MTNKSQQPNGGSADDAGNARQEQAAQPQTAATPTQQAAPSAQGTSSAAAPGRVGAGAPANGTGAPAPDAAPAAEGAADEREALAGELVALRTQLAETNDKHLRLLAEFDNFKKRMRKEQEEQLRYALLPLAKDLLAAIDNLERAVEHARQDNGGDSESLRAGIEMVLKQIADIFERHGMSRIKAAGEAFDPTVHEAMMIVEAADVPENQCIQEFQAGYVLHGRVVRPAMVSVSKRPPQPTGNGGQDGKD